ncbi:hypothetical protein GR140_18900 [Pseudomonas putida]|uniref:hypothetical protein n=1 Tax=Pseudomonas putida TaxID=303 RepID=UPI001BAF89E4|nr:hypothetical protein [Pseudomonas putida]QUG90734.1 hypothetical protein GR140_18900 [Pseudomonas putida]
MTEEEILTKVKSGEIEYSGDFFVNHNHNFNMTKAVAVSNRSVGRKKIIVDKILENYLGYDSISVSGVGFSNDSYFLLGHACYLLNKTKKLKVNIDIDEYMQILGISNVSNKSRCKKEIIQHISDIMDTSLHIKIKGRSFGRKIIIGYDENEAGDVISVYFCPSFVELQSFDKIMLSGSIGEYKKLERDTSIAVLDFLKSNNFKRGENEVYYADLKVGVSSGAKKKSHIKQSFLDAFDELVSSGFADYCKLQELDNKKVVVKFKLTKKGMMHDTSVSPNTPAIPAPVAAPVVSVNQVFMPADYDSMTLEQKLHALESKMAMIGINPEKLLHDQERAIIEGESEVVAEPDPWNTFDSSKFPDFIEPDNQADDELPF